MRETRILTMGTPNVNANFLSQVTAYVKKLEGYNDNTQVRFEGDKVIVDFDGDGKGDATIDSSKVTDTFKPQANNLVDLKFKLKNLEYDKSLAKDDAAKAAIDKQILETKDQINKSGATPEQLQQADNEVALRDYMEQKYVLEFKLAQAEKSNNANEVASCKNQLARLQMKIDKLKPSAEEVKAINDDISGPGNLPESKEEIKEEVVQTPISDEEKVKPLIGKELKVTNKNNPNGTIDGKITDIKLDSEGNPTSITVKSKTGNEFTYIVDEKTGKFKNSKEPNKYYDIDENMNLVRDNKLGRPIPPPPPPAPVVVEPAVVGIEGVEAKDIKAMGQGRWTDAQGNMYTKSKDEKGNDVYTLIKNEEPEKPKAGEVVTTKSGNITKTDYIQEDGTAAPVWERSNTRMYKSNKPVNDGYSTRVRNKSYHEVRDEFNKQIWSVSYLNSFIDNYGEDAAKDFIQNYNAEAKAKGGKSVLDKLSMTGLLDDRLKDILQLYKQKPTVTTGGYTAAPWRTVAAH